MVINTVRLGVDQSFITGEYKCSFIDQGYVPYYETNETEKKNIWWIMELANSFIGNLGALVDVDNYWTSSLL